MTLLLQKNHISPVSDGKQLTRSNILNQESKAGKNKIKNSGKEHKEMFNWDRVHQPFWSEGSRWSLEASVPQSTRHIKDFVIWGHWGRTCWCCPVCSVGKISGTSSHLGFSSSCTIFSLGGNKPIKRSIMSVSGSIVNLQYQELLLQKRCVRMSQNVKATHVCSWRCVSEAWDRGSGGAPAALPLLCVRQEHRRTCLIQRLWDFQRCVSSTFTGAQIAALSQSPDYVLSSQ